MKEGEKPGVEESSYKHKEAILASTLACDATGISDDVLAHNTRKVGKGHVNDGLWFTLQAKCPQ